MEWLLDAMQWPAMGLTILGAWLLGSARAARRHAGFWVFLASNVCWAVWGFHDRAYALILLQVALAAINVRGLRKTEEG